MWTEFDSSECSGTVAEQRTYSQKRVLAICSLILACVISACGGSSGGGSPPPVPQTFTVGGTVSGLSSGDSLVVQENGGGNTTIAANGSFTLPAALSSGDAYAITVLTPPSGKHCFVENRSGSISSNVTNVNISCGSSQLTLLAGATGGPGNADGPGTIARFDLRFAITDVSLLDRYWSMFGQAGIAVDTQGNVFVADANNHTVRRIDAAGMVTTIAGKAGVEGSTNGAAADARFRSPTGIAIDHHNNLYIADTGNNVIRKISSVGVVSTFAGSGMVGSADGPGTSASFNLAIERVALDALSGIWPECRGAVAVDAGDNVYVADCGNSTVRKITAAGDVSTFAGMAGVPGTSDGGGNAARFGYPVGLTIDSLGNIYVADAKLNPFASLSVGNTIRMITPAAVVTTVAGTPGEPGSSDGVGAAARFSLPADVAADPFGNVYVADNTNSEIRKIAPGGIVSTIAGNSLQRGSSDGGGSDARFDSPSSLAADSVGNLYVADAGNNTVRAITPGGVVSTLAGSTVVVGSSDGVGVAARFSSPRGITSDSAGNILVADVGNHTIRKITPSGSVTTFAGTAGQHGRSDGAAATFYDPSAVATDTSGNIYVADDFNQAIRKITPAGAVSTFAGNPLFNQLNGQQGPSWGGSSDGTGSSATFVLSVLPFPSPTNLALPFCHGGVATDRNANVYVADCGNDTIRKITPDGVVTTFAGTAQMTGSIDGTGAAARFKNPTGVATDSSGTVYVADAGNNVIRKITPTGVVTTLAGTAGMTGSDDGVGTAAGFNDPESLTTDDLGNLYVADSGNGTIRKITPDGTVTTVVGVAGTIGFTPGNLPGILGRPHGVTFRAGALYVTTENGVAMVTYVP